MGYRSEVYIGIVKEQKEDFKKLNNECMKVFELLKETDTHIVYKGEYLKWYSGFKDVQNFNSIVQSNEDNFCVAMGEDFAIHSEIGEWYDYIELEVKLNIL
jgi:hypothetical protein